MKILEVKEYSADLLKTVNKLLPQLTSNGSFVSEDALQEIISSGNTTLFIASEEGEIAGMLTLLTVQIPTGIRCIVEDVVVAKSLRGRGAGKALMLAAEQKAHKKGCTNINLTSSPARESANVLYKKLGYEIRETNVYRKVLK